MRDQSRYSLEYQESSISEYCKRNNIELLALFKDNGQSSYNFDRPNYIALENFIKKYKGLVNYLIVMDHDRFSRNLPEALMKIKSLENKFKIKVLATNESPDLDTNDPDVFMNRAFKYLMANNELLRIRQRTSRGIRQALEGGRFVNKAPYGYNNEKIEGRKGIIIINEHEAAVVRIIFLNFLLGHSITDIHKHAKTLGYPGISKSAVRRVLENCVYAGLIKVPESISGPERYVKGIHEPIIPAADFWRCQEILGKKGNLKSLPNEEVPLRGVLRHSCGASMTAGYSKGKKKYYLYYRCTQCSSLNVPGEKIHHTFQQVLELLSLPLYIINYMVKRSKEKIAEFLGSQKMQAKLKREELAALDVKIENLEEKMVNNEIEGQTYKKWFKKYSVQKSVIEAEIVSLNSANTEDLKKVDRILPALSDMPGIFKKANVFQKHSIINEVFKGGLVYVEGAFRTPFLHVAFSHNQLILKEKGLLFVEQSYQNLGTSTVCSEKGS